MDSPINGRWSVAINWNWTWNREGMRGHSTLLNATTCYCSQGMWKAWRARFCWKPKCMSWVILVHMTTIASKLLTTAVFRVARPTHTQANPYQLIGMKTNVDTPYNSHLLSIAVIMNYCWELTTRLWSTSQVSVLLYWTLFENVFSTSSVEILNHYKHKPQYHPYVLTVSMRWPVICEPILALWDVWRDIAYKLIAFFDLSPLSTGQIQ